ncbi:sensor histidine kinase [Planotetraspora thailandica]|uniref:sensor histidine kinase n=1 Tax=Planotetraspora thailandica TaxID=487172 RepID=UPI0019501CA4|nr:ATP-binding protein [Planotetraspora thailandica]
MALRAFCIVVPLAWIRLQVRGRALNSISAIRAELAALDVGDLSGRLPETQGHGEIVRLAAAVNTLLGRLEQAEKRAERALDQQRQFALDASHELRTPLAGLRLQLEDAQMNPDDTDLRNLLEHALRDLGRVQSIIADLLLLARLGTAAQATMEQVDLTALVRELTAHREGEQEIQLHLDPEVTVDAVPSHVTRMLTNLLDNAHRHAAGTIRIDLRRAGDSAELAIADDGEGIAPTDRERIFHRFVRLDSARSRDCGGTGLGLAIAHDIAFAHNGSLHVEDSASGGACFVLRMPLVTND